MLTFARKYHKWLMLFVGIQFLFWAVSGVYMVSMDIHHIHGESLVKKQSNKLNLADVNLSLTQLFSQYPNAKDISLVKLVDQQVYRFSHQTRERKIHLVDAKTGEVLPKIDQKFAQNIAQYHYAANHKVTKVELLTSTAPSELSPKHLPVWRVEFEHFSAPTFYISQESGQIVTKRHHYWRIFDWMWRFHIMDYDDGENVANWLLTLVTILGLLSALAGVVLTYLRIFNSAQQDSIKQANG